MIPYLIKSTICLALLMGFYYLFLEKEKMHHFNRFYLIGSILFSLLIPLCNLHLDTPTNIDISGSNSLNQAGGPITKLENIFLIIDHYSYYIFGFYLLISGVLLVRFGRHLYEIGHRINMNPKVKYKKATVVLLPLKVLPFTFWNYIFISRDDYKSNNIEEELFTHELSHVTQKHTLDILFIELIQIVFWFNPILVLSKKAIRLNHEFLADQTVVKSHNDITGYQYLLLNKAAGNNGFLASNLNYLITKKRFMMMAVPQSPVKILLKKVMVIPLLVGFTFLFSGKVDAEEKAIKPSVMELNLSTNEIEERNEVEGEVGHHKKENESSHFSGEKAKKSVKEESSEEGKEHRSEDEKESHGNEEHRSGHH
ncbi:M56 family metallopeptidase [Fulvivirgaceae bacterium BMA10]|uniref:M56 family metallopeptidase n=1 Tax=Splendidivirga corallicola TaxID=3051826 RepID=A0ABT8KN56_9BACT|nr:M56 family metallopeptidase [Fulvivirgaceae bacterium BMA10]